MENKARLGLALGGGGARGLAHIGILKGLEKAGIPISCIAGSSMGGLIAAVYASGMPVMEIEKRALEFSSLRRLARLLDFKASRRGLLESTNMLRFIEGLIGKDVTFTDLPIPLSLTTVDLNTGELLVQQEGSVVNATMATVSIPGLFPPVEDQNCRLIDGGVLNNLPVNVARRMGAEVVFAIDVSPDFHPGEANKETLQSDWPAFFPAFARDFYIAELIMVSALTQYQLRQSPPDLLLHPILPPGISIFWGFNRVAEAIAAGEACVENALEEIRSKTG